MGYLTIMLSINLLDSISQFGLTAGIAVYLVYFITKDLKECIVKLSNVIDKLSEKIDENNRKLNGVCKDVDNINYHLHQQRKQN